MKHRHIPFALFCAIIFLFQPETALFAQPGGDCGTTENLIHLKKTGQFKGEISSKKGPIALSPPGNPVPKRCGNLPVIPVVFHIFHLGEAVGSGSNISDAQVVAAVQKINNDWANQNGLGVPLDVRFELARRDPSGNPTTGINRINASAVPGYAMFGTSFQGSPGADVATLEAMSQWNNLDYYNVWVVRDINGFAAGYAYFPGYSGTPNNYDGTVVEATSVNGGSSVLSHELGHAFELAHTFDGSTTTDCPPDNDCTTDGDGICDTPPHKQADCGATNPCSATGVWDNSRFNYMSYCGGNRFTAGQKARVTTAVNQSDRRFLLLSKGLIPVNQPNELAFEAIVFPSLVSCSPSFKPIIKVTNNGIAAATSFDYQLILDGAPVGNFTQNATAIPPGQTLDIELAPITAGPGGHDFQVNLTGINGAGLDLYQYDNALCGYFEQKATVADFCQDFETIAIHPAMTFDNLWVTHFTPFSTNCPTEQDNGLIVEGNTSSLDEFQFAIGPLDLAGLVSPKLFFDLARQQPYYNCNEYATLTVTASNDCGKNPVVIYEKNDAPPFPCGGNTYPNTPQRLNTTYGAVNGTLFSPDNCDDWRREALDLAAFTGQTVTLRFSVKFFRAQSESNILFFDNFCLNKCAAPTAPFALVPMPDTLHICFSGAQDMTLATNQADDNNTVYFWEESDLPNGPWQLSSNTKTVTAIGFTIGTTYFRGISMKNGCEDTLSVVLVTHPDVAVLTGPLGTTACFGQSITLTSTASNAGLTPVFQWQSGPTGSGPWTDIAGTTSANYTFVPPLGNGYYHVLAGAAEPGCQTDFSFPAFVKVEEPVQITAEPQPVTECQGGNAPFSITATGGGNPKFQWQRATAATGPWTNFGTNTPTATPNAATVGTYYIRVIVSSTNGYCKDTSLVVTQTVVADPVVSQQPVAFTGCVGQPVVFSANATGGTGTFSYQWTTSPDIFAGFTPVPGAVNPTFSPNGTAGINYFQVVITQSGTGCNTLNSNAVSLALDDPAIVTADPQPIAECIGGLLEMNPTVSGTGLLQYQWQSAGAATGPWANYPNFAPDFTPPSAVIGTAFYRLIVRSENGFCKDTSAAATAQIVSQPSITDQPDSYSGCSANQVVLSVGAAGGFAPLVYQWQSSTSQFGPFLPINNSNSPDFNVQNQTGTLFYQVVVSTSGGGCPAATSQVASVNLGGGVNITTEPEDIAECVGSGKSMFVVASGAGTLIYIWQIATSPMGPFTTIAGANASTFTPPSDILGFGEYYRVIVQLANSTCADTSAVAQVFVFPVPEIVKQPDSYMGCLGNPVTLKFGVNTLGPISVQWQDASSAAGPFSNIPGATELYFPVPNTTGSNFYRVVLSFIPSSGCPDVVSQPANVVLDGIVKISAQPQPVSECTGGALPMSAIATGSGALTYQWQFSANQNGPFANVLGANAASFTPSTVAAGSDFFRLVISSPNGFCKDTTDVAAAQIFPDPSILTQPIGFTGCAGSQISLKATATGGTGPLNFQWQNAPSAVGPFTNINGATAPSFTAPNNPSTVFYQLVASSPGAGCGVATSSAAAVVIDSLVLIFANPPDVSECVGGADFITVSASDGTLQWQSSGSPSGPFVNVAGANSSQLTPSSVVAGTNYFRAILSSANGFCRDTSMVSAFQIVPDLAVSPQPQDFTGCVGSSLTLVSGATGGILPQFQWQSAAFATGPWADVPGANQPNFSPPLGTAGTVFYQMVASSATPGCGSATSDPAQALVGPAVQVSVQPASISECFGGNQTITATATGGTVFSYKWQKQLPGGLWMDIAGATGASLVPPSTTNFSQNNYRVIVSNGNANCAEAISPVVKVSVETNFSIKADLETCNFTSGSQPSMVDFNSLVLTGDPTPVWQSLDAAAPPGTWTAKDFTGWPPNQTFRFMATMDDNIAPCKALSDTVFVKILDCCPVICTDAPTASLCNSAAQPFELGSLECAGVAPGSWFLTAGPGVSGQTPLPNGQFDPAGRPEGSYTVVYQLAGNVPPVCASTSSETLTIIESPEAGTTAGAAVFCENETQTILLADLLTGEDLGGLWSDISQSPAPGGSFNPSAGTLNLTNLPPGDYLFRYKISGVAGCPGDEATVAIKIGKLPTAIAGPNSELTCNEPTAQIGNPLNGANGATIFWEETSHSGFVSDPTAPVLTIAEPGVYQLTATDPATGCSATDVVEISASLNFITDVEILANDPNCHGFSDGKIEVVKIVGGAPPISVSLNGVAAGLGQKFSGLKPGVFNLKIVDKDGCSTERNVVLADPPLLTVSLPGDTTIWCGDSVLLNPVFDGGAGLISWQWFANLTRLPVLADANLWAKPAQKTLFSIKITDGNGCRAEASTKIAVDENLPIFAPTAFKPGSEANAVFKIFAHEKVEKVASFRVFDRGGNLVFEQKNKSLDDADFGWDGSFRGKELPPGVFVFVAEVDLCDHRRAVLKGSITLVR